MAQWLLRGIANPVTRKRFPGSNPGPGVLHFCIFHDVQERHENLIYSQYSLY